MKKKVLIIVFIIMLCIIVSSIVIFVRSRPRAALSREMGIESVNHEDVLEYTWKYSYGRLQFKAKLIIPENVLPQIKEELNSYFGHDNLDSGHDVPNFQNTCAWWDLDQELILHRYMKFESGYAFPFINGPKTASIYAFITLSRDGDYYLYISY